MALAVIHYNDGVTALANILKHLGIDPRKPIIELFQELDSKRLYQVKRTSSQRQQKVDVMQLEYMKPMKQSLKYDVGYSSRQYTHAQADSPLDYIEPSDNEDDLLNSYTGIIADSEYDIVNNV